jgi:hypothetical protein
VSSATLRARPIPAPQRAALADAVSHSSDLNLLAVVRQLKVDAAREAFVGLRV